MRKILAVMILAAVLIYSTNFARAQDVYAGVYPVTNLSAYLMTETIKITGVNPAGPIFTCTIRAGKNYYINYRFYVTGAMVNGVDNRRNFWRNSDGYSGYVFGGDCPVEAATYKYVVNNVSWN